MFLCGNSLLLHISADKNTSQRSANGPPCTSNTSKLESLSPNNRRILYKNTGSGEVEREARQPRASAPPEVRGTSGATDHDERSWFAPNGFSACGERSTRFTLLLLLPRPLWVGGGSERGGGGDGQWWAAVSVA